MTFLKNYWCLAAWGSEVPAEGMLARQIAGEHLHAFADQDFPLVSAQTRRIAGRDFWSLRPALLPPRKDRVLVRRTFDAMLAGVAGRSGILAQQMEKSS